MVERIHRRATDMRKPKSMRSLGLFLRLQQKEFAIMLKKLQFNISWVIGYG
jgi:hypothetical protein